MYTEKGENKINTSALATTLVKDRVESENIYWGDYYSGKTEYRALTQS